jgi:phage-related protein
VERVSEKFLKDLEGTDGLFEVRVEYQSTIYRIFCCFDEGKLVVLFNGFQKKTQKTRCIAIFAIHNYLEKIEMITPTFTPVAKQNTLIQINRRH